MKLDYRKIIYSKLKKAGKKPLTFKELLRSCRGKGFEFEKFTKAVDKMKKNGEIMEDKFGIRLVDPKKFVKGEGACTEGEVMSIVEENFAKFTGELVSEFGVLKIVPDMLSKYAMIFENPMRLELHEGDKVVAQVTKRGNRHSEHVCEIVSSYGSSMKASACAMSVLEVNGLTPVFPSEVIYEAREVSDYSRIKEEIPNRLDLRDKPIFTIDGADTKDIDDAISVERTKTGYLLGVHIADVSHYVQPKSQLDNEAFKRGTSVYYANRVIPMLPKELSNGICSLNPQEDRLAFSCLCELDKQGNITDYKFAKTVIRSRVKGVYSEINSLLAGSDDAELKEKYADVSGQLPIIKELADILYKNKKNRGCPELETSESKLIINDEDICVGVERRTRGRSEEIIEDFMLVANECAARFGMDNNLPFVYRIHEEPSDEKLESLREALVKLNVQYKLGEKACPGDMSEILKAAKGTDIDLIMNNIVLRSMSKARYSTEPVGHFGLALEDYAHFTSPIRRYPDLTIHRIMSAFLSGSSAEECATKFNKFVYASADQSTKTELTAMQVERSCEDCYKAEYMNAHIGEEFQGTVVSAVEFGLFIALPDTCEGLLHTDNMPDGEYVCDDMVSLKNLTNGMEYRVGDPIRVKVINANVNSGKIDFALADED